jgi:hypothetical protein
LFRKVPKERGHLRTVQKLGPFVRHFDGPNGINTQLKEMLEGRGFKAGSDVVVMVINEGEIDLFLNFVCSCHLHNITTSNVLVFAGSKEIITMIESTGAMGIYHEGYSSVSKKASTDYLDRPFVDMMWYKAFSVYLVLQLKINVLFQDVDLVWFRDPFPVFHNWTGRDGIPLRPPNKVILRDITIIEHYHSHARHPLGVPSCYVFFMSCHDILLITPFFMCSITVSFLSNSCPYVISLSYLCIPAD